METRELLLRLLHRSLIEIRMASRDGDLRTGLALSDFLHGLPLAMIGGDPEKVLLELIERADILGFSSWLQQAQKNIIENSRDNR